MTTHRNHRSRPALRSLHQSTRGAVYVEFLIAFIPFFVMVLGMMQEALMYSAHLIVQHAATSAARAAIVAMPECEYRYDGAAQNDADGGGSGGDPVSALTGFLGGGGGASIGFPTGAGGGSIYSRGGARLDEVRFAANVPLVATSPSLDELEGDRSSRQNSILSAIGGTTSPAVRLALGAFAYNNVAMSVTFPRSARATDFNNRPGARSQLTARVTYAFHCGVPIVASMACDDAIALFSGVPTTQLRDAARAVSSGRSSIAEIRSSLERVRIARERLSNANPGMRELEGSRAGYAVSGVLLAATGGHFSIIRAEATMPNQGTARTIARPCFRDR